jgi:phosphoinositide-3-kinase regulatory subunit 4
MLVAKLQALDVPVLPPDLGTTENAPRTLGISASPLEKADWKPKVDGILASSSPVTGHSACATRLAVSADQSFFVSASHDGSCRVWELKQLRDSNGMLESSAVYSRQPIGEPSVTSMPRINDVTIVENSHSVASGGSDGSVHVWRVDMVSSRKTPEGATETRTVSGSTDIRKVENSEGEILAVSHFNSLSASLLMFATQSCVHSWDLRSPREPFKLEHRPDLGYQTAMAIGTDRNWMLTGTSKGFLALWDLRFQQTAKLWRHSSGSQIRRLATSENSPSRHRQGDENRPILLVSSGQNECAAFDVVSGLCHQSFRVTSTSSQMRFSSNLPSLRDVPVTSGSIRAGMSFGESTRNGSQYAESCINAMIASFTGERSFLITGGDDCCIRYWDVTSPAKCYTVSGLSSAYQRASYERIDSNGGRSMICQQARRVKQSDIECSRLPRMLQKGTARPDSHNFDSIQDLKLISHPMQGYLSCSRDGLVRVWH